jgi:hypothetical protein
MDHAITIAPAALFTITEKKLPAARWAAATRCARSRA